MPGSVPSSTMTSRPPRAHGRPRRAPPAARCRDDAAAAAPRRRAGRGGTASVDRDHDGGPEQSLRRAPRRCPRSPASPSAGTSPARSSSAVAPRPSLTAWRSATPAASPESLPCSESLPAGSTPAAVARSAAAAGPRGHRPAERPDRPAGCSRRHGRSVSARVHYLEFLGAFTSCSQRRRTWRSASATATASRWPAGRRRHRPRVRPARRAARRRPAVRETSDEYFDRADPLAPLGGRRVGLSFIDGMHLAEFALRDFINVERCHRSGAVVFDDILPRSADEAARGRHTRAWTGDVYKMLGILARHRPDLICLRVGTEPTGLLLVLGLDPAAACWPSATTRSCATWSRRTRRTSPTRCSSVAARSTQGARRVVLVAAGQRRRVPARRAGGSGGACGATCARSAR